MYSAVVPLRITDTENNIFWQNPNSSSVRFCRPLRISWEKEDKETTQREYNRLKNEIDNLYLTEILYKEKKYKLIHKPILTMFDGKAVNILTNTASSMVCPNCNAKPNDFNKLDSITKFPLNKNSLYLGISPLHMLIRGLEYILHLAYRLHIKKWRVAKAQKPEMERVKREIQNSFKHFMSGLKIDQIRNGAGTSNNGNAGRKIADNPELTSQITGVDLVIITNISYMLKAINSGYNINAENFRKIGLETAKRHVELYNWFKIPVSMHRLWFHVPDIALACPVSIGHSSEEAIESSHKCLIKALNNHCRQDSYEKMTLDMGTNRLINTDPQVTKYFKPPIVRNKKKPKGLLAGVKALLIDCPDNVNSDNINDSDNVDNIEIYDNIDPLLFINDPEFENEL